MSAKTSPVSSHRLIWYAALLAVLVAAMLVFYSRSAAERPPETAPAAPAAEAPAP